MPFNGRMDKEDVVHIHSGVLCLLRKDEYPTFIPTWTGVEEIMLSEIGQAERVNYHMVLLICGA